ncbi:MAG: YjjG family noncanonical pyrimidine nucleotidase [Acutalibacteraceae bacterium]|nr:YjjG family noncanonical pyrimidine nucleotidase [Acutalibacteraceae bacterium]
MNNKYTTILFDADNTLLDFDKDEHQALVRTLEDYGVPVTEENISTYVNINKSLWKKIETGEITKPELKRTRFRLFFDAIGFECDEEPLSVNEHYLALLGEGGNTLEGAVELCKELKSKDYDLYIVTNGVAATQAKRLTKAGLLPYFTEVFVSETVGYQKPKKEYFDYVLNTVKEKDKSRILLVGDSLSSDIQGAMNVGLPCCWLNLFGDVAGEKYKIDYIIDDIRKVTDIL